MIQSCVEETIIKNAKHLQGIGCTNPNCPDIIRVSLFFHLCTYVDYILRRAKFSVPPASLHLRWSDPHLIEVSEG